jgi:hypothetical protein
VGVQQSLVSVLMEAGAKIRYAFQRDILLEASRDANLGIIWLLSSCAADFARSNYDKVHSAALSYGSSACSCCGTAKTVFCEYFLWCVYTF